MAYTQCACCNRAATTERRIRIARASLVEVGRLDSTITFALRSRYKKFPACDEHAKVSQNEFRIAGGITVKKAEVSSDG